jgi:hypothetical protein
VGILTSFFIVSLLIGLLSFFTNDCNEQDQQFGRVGEKWNDIIHDIGKGHNTFLSVVVMAGASLPNTGASRLFAYFNRSGRMCFRSLRNIEFKSFFGSNKMIFLRHLDKSRHKATKADISRLKSRLLMHYIVWRGAF